MKESEFEEKTHSYSLGVEIEQALMPLRYLIDLTKHDFDSDPMNDFHPLLEFVFGKVEKDLEKIVDFVEEHIGGIDITMVCYGESLKVDNKHFRGGDRVKASISTKSENAITSAD